MVLKQLGRGTEELEPVARLSDRERDVLVHIAHGLSNKEIAAQMGVSVRTVETHRERTMRKLEIRSVAGLTKFALAHGLISL
jgi:DNA-binding NarL/FixJ family response regulator